MEPFTKRIVVAFLIYLAGYLTGALTGGSLDVWQWTPTLRTAVLSLGILAVVIYFATATFHPIRPNKPEPKKLLPNNVVRIWVVK